MLDTGQSSLLPSHAVHACRTIMLLSGHFRSQLSVISSHDRYPQDKKICRFRFSCEILTPSSPTVLSKSTMGFGKSSKSEGKKKKEGKYAGSAFTWFETSVNGGVHVLQILRQVSAKAPIPYLTQAAGAALVVIQIAQVRFCHKIGVSNRNQFALDTAFRTSKITEATFED